MEIKDLAGFSQPLTKLIEVVSSAVGAAYRPKAIRDEAEAQAYARKTLSIADAEAAITVKGLQITAHMNLVHQALKEHPELAERARQRLLAREVEGQLNVESIADFAATALPAAVSSEPVSPDWRRKFFIEAESVCEIDLQMLWGKVLAGEVTSPGIYSMRTLETLRQLSRAEAELFRKACAIAMADGWIAIPDGDFNAYLKPFGLTYSDILSLRDAGLVLDGDQIHKDFTHFDRLPDGNVQPVILMNNGTLIQLSGPSTVALRVPALVFTRAGRELQRLNEPNETSSYLSALALSLRQRGLVVKRGTPIPQGEGISVITFDDDL